MSLDHKVLIFARFLFWFTLLAFFLFQQGAMVPAVGGYTPLLALLYTGISTFILILWDDKRSSHPLLFGLDLAWIAALAYFTLSVTPLFLFLFLPVFLYYGCLRKNQWVYGASIGLLALIGVSYLIHPSIPLITMAFALVLVISGLWIGFFSGRDSREIAQMSVEMASLKEIRRKLEYEQKLVERHQYTIEELSTIDSLTRVYNRPYLLEKGTLILEEAYRKKESVGILLVDIDHFKKYNDTFGHLVGDKTLRVVSDVMKAAIRVDDLIGRYGGEEFLIIQPGRSLSEAYVAAERIRQNIETQAISLLNRATGMNIPLTVTISIGLVASDPNSPEDVDALIHKADIALYTAKQKGRNQVQIYQSP